MRHHTTRTRRPARGDQTRRVTDCKVCKVPPPSCGRSRTDLFSRWPPHRAISPPAPRLSHLKHRHTRAGRRDDIPPRTHRAVAAGGVPAYPAPENQASTNIRSSPQFLRSPTHWRRKPQRDHHLSQSPPDRTTWCDFRQSDPGDMMLSATQASPDRRCDTHRILTPHDRTLSYSHPTTVGGDRDGHTRGKLDSVDQARGVNPVHRKDFRVGSVRVALDPLQIHHEHATDLTRHK